MPIKIADWNKLTNPTIQGTVLAGTGLTMPAFTAGGNITLGAYKLVTTDLLLKQDNSEQMIVRNAADNATKGLVTQTLYAVASVSIENAGYLAPSDTNTHCMALKARDTDVGLVEIARLQGAADPYFQATLPMVLLPIATGSLPGTPVEGMIAYNATLNKLVVYTGAAWEAVTSV